MAVITAKTGARSWSTATDWIDEVVPIDNTDSAIIPADCQILMNQDQRTWTGLLGITIASHASTPGTIYWKNDTDGYLKLKTGNNIVGNADGDIKGRLLANSDGIWDNNTPLSQDNRAVILLGSTSSIVSQYLDIKLLDNEPTTKYIRTYGQIFHECTVSATTNTLTYPAIDHALPINTLVQVSGALPAELSSNTDYWIQSTDAETITLKATPTGDIIDLSVGGPINIHVGLYTDCGISGNTITKTGHGLSAGTAIMVKSTGTLPTPLVENRLYWISSTGLTADAFSLMWYASTTPIITLGGSPSGTLTIYTGSTGAVSSGGIGGINPYTTTKMNLLDDVTGESTYWIPDVGTFANTTNLNAIILVNEGPQSYDQQRLGLTEVTSTIATLNESVNSVQFPNAKIVLASRNVAIQSSCTTNINVIDYTLSPNSSGIFNCEIRSTVGIGTTFNGSGIVSGTSHTIESVISGFTYGIIGINNSTINGLITACSYGIRQNMSNAINGTIIGCNIGADTTINSTINSPFFGCTTCNSNGLSNVISGPITGCSTVVNYGTGETISSIITGCYNASYGSNSLISTATIIGCDSNFKENKGPIIGGSITGCSNGVLASTLSSEYVISANFSNCNIAVNSNSGNIILRGATFTNNTIDISGQSSIIGYGVTLSSGVQEVNNYNIPVTMEGMTHCYYDYGTPGYIRAFMPCGSISTIITPTSPIDTMPTGTYAYKMLGEVPGTGGLQRACFLDIPVYGKSGIPIEISIYEKCNIIPSTFIEDPKFAICDPSKLFRDATGILNSEGLITAQSLGDDTDWHTTRLTYLPNDNKPLVLRSYAKCIAVTGLTGNDASGLNCAILTADSTHCTMIPEVAPNWTTNALIGMYVQFESDLTYCYISGNIATELTIISDQSANTNRRAWTIVGMPTYYHWMYNIDSMVPVASNKVMSGTPRWTGATGDNVGSLNVNYSY